MKKTRFSLVLLLSFLLSACSSSFIYNNIDWLLYWYVDDYVELTPSQKVTLDEHVDSWLAWHRSVELKKYQVQLNNLRARLQAAPLDQAQWLSVFDEMQQNVQRLRDKMAPDLAVMAQQLSPEQVAGIVTQWRKDTQERQSDVAEQSKKERLADRQKDLVEQVEDKIGKLTPEQTQIIQRYVLKFLPTFEQRVLYQATLQQTVEDLFAKPNAREFTQQLTSIITDPEQYKTPEYKVASEHNKVLYAQMLAELNLFFTKQQKQTLDDKLKEWMQLIEGLMADSHSP